MPILDTNSVVHLLNSVEPATKQLKYFYGWTIDTVRFLFDLIQSYQHSFSIFIGLLFASAGLSLVLRPPRK